MATACADPCTGDLYSVEQLRAIESAALSALPAGTLMQRAGRAVADAAIAMLAACNPSNQSKANILIAAGPGNNGGDALEAAGLLANQGHHVYVVMPAVPTLSASLPSDAQQALNKAQQSPAHFMDLPSVSSANLHWDLAIDGLFGIGLSRALDGDFRKMAQQLNALDCPVLAIDIPSGLDADHGTVIGADGIAVHADRTISFIANKPGLHTAQGRDYAGVVMLEGLAIDRALYGPPLAHLNQSALFVHAMHPRLHASHKGSFGELSLLGGASGMGGAMLLAARMGAMAGAGRVYAGFIDQPPAFDPQHPELMCRSASTLTLDSGAIVAGPGMGQSSGAQEALARALSSRLPLVLDADALNLLALEPSLQQRLRNRRAATLLTPHPLEAARLLNVRATQIQADRLHTAHQLASQYQAVVILKGSGSVIAAPDGRLVINPTGNPALATAGTGDVLAGLCGALLAQQWPAWEAALAAVWLHGKAADHMVADGIGPLGLTAGELLPVIRKELNQLIAASA